jgi:hypothetical protein
MTNKELVLKTMIEEAAEKSEEFKHKISYWKRRNKPVDTQWLFNQLLAAIGPVSIKQHLGSIAPQ